MNPHRLWLRVEPGGFTPPQSIGFSNPWPTPVGYLGQTESHAMGKGVR